MGRKAQWVIGMVASILLAGAAHAEPPPGKAPVKPASKPVATKRQPGLVPGPGPVVTGIRAVPCLRDGAVYTAQGKELTGVLPRCETDCPGVTAEPQVGKEPACRIAGHPPGGRSCHVKIRVGTRWVSHDVKTCAPDLALQLRGPSQAKAGEALDRIQVDVRNNGKGGADGYRLEVELRRGERGTGLGSESGQGLEPGGRRDHAFTRISLGPQITEGDYQLCARVTTSADANARNDEACEPLVVKQEGASRLRAGKPGAPKGAVVEKPAAVRPAPKPGGFEKKAKASAPARSSSAAVEGEAMAPAPASTMLMADLESRRRMFRSLQMSRTTAVTSARRIYDEYLLAESARGDDCDDSRPDVNPHATEVCDGVDNDCDGEVDEGQTILAYADADGDGHGAPDSAIEVCPDEFREAQEEGEWLSMIGNDCDDSDPDRWHGCE